jgi:hypothetical protein
MVNADHSSQTVLDGIHIIHAFEYANAITRTGATGLTSADIGKVAKQIDDNSFWILLNNNPVSWTGVNITTKIYETSGPTTLNIGSIADGETLSRSGTNIIGISPVGGAFLTQVTRVRPDGLSNPISYGNSTTTDVLLTAIAACLSGDTLLVPAGTFTSSSSLNIPSNVKVVSLYGKEVTTLAVADGYDVVTLNTGCELYGFNIMVPTSDNYGINSNSSVSSSLKDIRFQGQGGSGTSMIKSSSGSINIQEWLHTGNVDKVFEISHSDSVVISHGGNILAGTINDGIYMNGGRFNAFDLGMSSPNMVQAFHITSGEVDVNGCSFRDVNTGIYVDGDDVNVRFIASQFHSQMTTHLLAESIVLTGNISISSSTLNLSKTTYPSTNDNIKLYYLDDREGDEALQIETETAIGKEGRGRELSVGEGDSITNGMVVFQNTNLEVGSYTDITTIAASPTQSITNLFAGLGSNNCVYLGGDHIFPGVKLNMTTASVLGTGSIIIEYWNGSSWSLVPAMSSDATYPYSQYGRTSLDKVGLYQTRFGTLTGWSLKTINSEEKYWIRARIVTDIITSPAIQQVKLHVNSWKCNVDGFTELIGKARKSKLLPIHRLLLDDISGSSPSNTDVTISQNITLSSVENTFVNNTVDARG